MALRVPALAAGLVTAVLLVITVPVASYRAGEPFRVKLCVDRGFSAERLQRCTDTLSRANTTELSFECVIRPATVSCMRAVSEGIAHLTNLDAVGTYRAWNQYDLRPLLSENYGNKVGGQTYGVAVVREEFCSNETMLSDLKGTRACMAEYDSLVGWTLPVGQLHASSAMGVINEYGSWHDDAESAIGFFDTLCAIPHSTYPALDPTSQPEPFNQLCTACKDPSACNHEDDYFGEVGAFRGLVEGSCDVAFTNMRVPSMYAEDGSFSERPDWSTLPADTFRLLCSQGGCSPVDEPEQCNMGQSPGRAFVARDTWNRYGREEELGTKVKEALEAAAESRTFMQALADLRVVDPTAVGLDEANIFSLPAYMDTDVISAFESLDELRRPARICVAGEAEAAACTNVVSALREFDYGRGRLFQWGCVEAGSHLECLDLIADGSAELRLADSAEQFEAKALYNLVPLVAETYGDGVDNSYYSVAVVRNEWCEEGDGDRQLEDLRGLNMTSNGYRTGAAWWMPLGALAAANLVSPLGNVEGIASDALAMAGFFDTVCAPGVGDRGPYASEDVMVDGDENEQPGSLGLPWSGLCDGCHDPLACTAGNSTTDLYSEGQGPLLALKEGAANVAFVKHSHLQDFFEDSEAGDYRLMCKSGGCMGLDDYASCNWGRLPPRALVTNSAYTHANALRQLLRDAAADPVVGPTLFAEEGFGWGPGASGLVEVVGSNYQYLGEVLPQYQALYTAHWLGDGRVAGRAIGNILVCVPAPVDSDYLRDCSLVWGKADSLDLMITFNCVAGGSALDCMRMIAQGNADLTVLDAADQHYAQTTFTLLPLVTEVYEGQQEYADVAVAVVPAAWCEGVNRTFEELKGMHGCFTGYSKMAGWQVPTGFLTERGLLQHPTSMEEGVQPDALAMQSFFGTVCAPGSSYLGPTFNSTGHSNELPDLCQGCIEGVCPNTSPHGESADDNAAAMRCLMEGGADVAFVAFSAALGVSLNTRFEAAPDDETASSIFTNEQLDELRLLCPEDGCVEIDAGAALVCQLETVVPQAVVGRADLVGSTVANMLVAASQMDSSFMEAAHKLDGVPNFPFSNETIVLEKVKGEEDTIRAASKDLLEASDRLRTPNVSLCVTDQQSLALCEQVMPNLNANQEHASFSCYLATDCAAAVAAGEADLAVLDAYNLWVAHKDSGLVAIAAEEAGGGTVADYAVAVVAASNCEAIGGLEGLKGRDACFTGYQHTVGWVIPTGYMLAHNVMSLQSEEEGISDDAESVAAFFNHVCAPRVANGGPQFTSDGKGELWEPGLCMACAGDCTTESPYYDSGGAMRCLMEGGGDVAFVKHSAAADYARGGPLQQDWSISSSADLALLCPSGGCAAVDDYLSCNFAAVPSDAVVARATQANIPRIQKALANAALNTAFASAVFNTSANPGDLLFKSSTLALSPVYDTVAHIGASSLAFDPFERLDTPSSETAGRRRRLHPQQP